VAALFAKTECILPISETVHTIKAAIDTAD